MNHSGCYRYSDLSLTHLRFHCCVEVGVLVPVKRDKQASKLLQTVKELVNEEKYLENKAIIEELILELFKSSDKRGI